MMIISRRGRYGQSKWPTGFQKGFILRFLGALNSKQLSLKTFFHSGILTPHERTKLGLKSPILTFSLRLLKLDHKSKVTVHKIFTHNECYIEEKIFLANVWKSYRDTCRVDSLYTPIFEWWMNFTNSTLEMKPQDAQTRKKWRNEKENFSAFVS